MINTTIWSRWPLPRSVWSAPRMNQADIDEAGFEANQWVDMFSRMVWNVLCIVSVLCLSAWQLGRLLSGNQSFGGIHDKYAKIPASKSVPVILQMHLSTLTWQQPLTLKMQSQQPLNQTRHLKCNSNKWNKRHFEIREIILTPHAYEHYKYSGLTKPNLKMF